MSLGFFPTGWGAATLALAPFWAGRARVDFALAIFRAGRFAIASALAVFRMGRGAIAFTITVLGLWVSVAPRSWPLSVSPAAAAWIGREGSGDGWRGVRSREGCTSLTKMSERLTGPSISLARSLRRISAAPPVEAQTSRTPPESSLSRTLIATSLVAQLFVV